MVETQPPFTIGASMFRLFVLGLASAAVIAATPSVERARAKSPAWLSIEAPVNPYDQETRGAALLVHASLHGNPVALSDLSGSAEGLVNGTRRTMALRFDATSRPAVFALRRQWPTEGTWLVRISLSATTAIVTLDRNGDVAAVRVPTTPSQGVQLPRAVAPGEIDSTLAARARR
jgi:hypothetical protein